MRVAGIIRNSVVNGIGIRDVIFLQGCMHHCKGCHNPETWKVEGGKVYTVEELVAEFEDSTNDITISGGEPFLQFEEMFHFIKAMRMKGKHVWLYTGYTYEEIPWFELWMLAGYVDVLVDGRFEVNKKDLKLKFRGSSNQRLINLKKSVELRQVVLWGDGNV